MTVESITPDFAAFDEKKIITMEEFTGPPADQLLALSGIVDTAAKESVHLLESAAGGGCLTAALFRALPPAQVDRVKIISGDVVPEMVQLAGARSIKEGWKNVEFKVFDGMALPFEDGTFSHAMIHYGIQLYPDPSKGISENHRVLKRGGVFGVSVWHTPGFLPYLQRADPSFTVPAPMRHPLTRAETATETLNAAGFNRIRTEPVQVSIEFAGPKQAVAGWLAIMRGLFKSDEVAKRVEELLREDHGDGPFKLNWEGIIVVANKA